MKNQHLLGMLIVLLLSLGSCTTTPTETEETTPPETVGHWKGFIFKDSFILKSLKLLKYI